MRPWRQTCGTETCKACNSAAMVTLLRLYGTTTFGPRHQATQSSTPQPPCTPHRRELDNSLKYSNMYGTDTRTVSTDCSKPDVTFNYTVSENAARVVVSNCPMGSIEFGHDSDGIGNKVSISATGGTAVAKQDQGVDPDRWMLHTLSAS